MLYTCFSSFALCFVFASALGGICLSGFSLSELEDVGKRVHLLSPQEATAEARHVALQPIVAVAHVEEVEIHVRHGRHAVFHRNVVEEGLVGHGRVGSRRQFAADAQFQPVVPESARELE